MKIPITSFIAEMPPHKEFKDFRLDQNIETFGKIEKINYNPSYNIVEVTCDNGWTALIPTHCVYAMHINGDENK